MSSREMPAVQALAELEFTNTFSNFADATAVAAIAGQGRVTEQTLVVPFNEQWEIVALGGRYVRNAPEVQFEAGWCEMQVEAARGKGSGATLPFAFQSVDTTDAVPQLLFLYNQISQVPLTAPPGAVIVMAINWTNTHGTLTYQVTGHLAAVIRRFRVAPE